MNRLILFESVIKTILLLHAHTHTLQITSTLSFFIIKLEHAVEMKTSLQLSISIECIQVLGAFFLLSSFIY